MYIEVDLKENNVCQSSPENNGRLRINEDHFYMMFFLGSATPFYYFLFMFCIF
jgi:hypothetical protein